MNKFATHFKQGVAHRTLKPIGLCYSARRLGAQRATPLTKSYFIYTDFLSRKSNSTPPEPVAFILVSV